MSINATNGQIADISNLNRLLYKNIVNRQTSSQKASDVQDSSREDDMKLIKNDIFKNVDVDDIKKSAELIGESISDEDIKYGLMYGRSVLADYSA